MARPPGCLTGEYARWNWLPESGPVMAQAHSLPGAR
jgi:hypothetical protein